MEGTSESLTQVVMTVDLADAASRVRARQAVESLMTNGVTEKRSRLLAKQVRMLAERDVSSAHIAEDMNHLATTVRKLDSLMGRKGIMDRLFRSAERRAARVEAARKEIKDLVTSLSRSAEVLRQNDVALDGYEADVQAEAKQLEEDVARADSLEKALVEAMESARSEGATEGVARFAELEVLYPLQQHRQHLQSLKAVNQQMLFSLSVLRENNASLVQSLRQVTVATKNVLDAAGALRCISSGGRDMAALEASLGELSLALKGYDAWRRRASGRQAKALQCLEDLRPDAS